jgi:uncharacterized repeat protein (TIGR04076 family)
MITTILAKQGGIYIKRRSQMADRYDVRVKVISQKGTCVNGHKVGDEFVISRTTTDGICLGAFGAFFSFLRTLMFGGTFPWSPDPDAATVACPDAENPVVFELRRIRTEA